MSIIVFSKLKSYHFSNIISSYIEKVHDTYQTGVDYADAYQSSFYADFVKEALFLWNLYILSNLTDLRIILSPVYLKLILKTRVRQEDEHL